ncbi:hypothetical protein [Devosia sp. SD17-2]|uniref:hypothetical protein n=1 Tax=Devosia sp. SD17-2 TaxID=2976459 RepID=UPI0023D7B7BB|nr:hypothetical protein [Devosia sp. SD17-2]WEJ32000.1 hypothetical protein NYQ88_13935 [Devosia sp. SD17-2]
MREQLQRRYDQRREGITTGRVMYGSVIIQDVHRFESQWQFSLPLLRLREIEWVITSRHGKLIPDPYDTDDVDMCLAYARAVEASKTPQDLVHWSRRWMPWAPAAEIDRIVLQEGWRQKPAGADHVATMIYVSAAERQALGLRTIGAYDVTKEQRLATAADAKRERDKQRQAERRRAEGRVDRQTYLESSLSAQKPWETLEMSRAKYYRLKGRETGVSPVTVINTNSDGLVSQVGTFEEPARKVA